MKNANSAHASHVEVVKERLEALHEKGLEGYMAIAYLVGGPVGTANNRAIIRVLQENRLAGPNKKVLPDVADVAKRLYGCQLSGPSAQKPSPVSSKRHAPSLVCGG